jgi:Membrane bound beta barrel domain (DUF5777)
VSHLRTVWTALFVLWLSIGVTSAARAQDVDPETLRLAEPDFTLINLPTSLRLRKFGSAFRVTHRFTRPLDQGDFGDLVEDLFGLDSGARIGLEYRFGIIPNGQIGIHRTSDKTIQFFAQYSLWRQDQAMPIEVSVLGTIDGTNNFKDSYSPAIGAIVGRTFGSVTAVYIEPIWVNNTNPEPSEPGSDNDTFMVGLGARVRIRPTVYLVGEVAPRTGYKEGETQGGFAIEKRVGGHTFQLNFSNGFGTTMANIARGGPQIIEGWFIGFNISRKFY